MPATAAQLAAVNAKVSETLAQRQPAPSNADAHTRIADRIEAELTRHLGWVEGMKTVDVVAMRLNAMSEAELAGMRAAIARHRLLAAQAQKAA
jgi:hypothetical protein